jgi:hypothetical protein
VCFLIEVPIMEEVEAQGCILLGWGNSAQKKQVDGSASRRGFQLP